MEEPKTTTLATQTEPQPSLSPAILAPGNFELAQRMATALSKSNIIPQTFQNNLPNCLIALEMSNRMGIPAMMVMQNLYVVHGKPAWSSQFVIAAINSTGRFSPLRFALSGTGDSRVCIAWAIELATSEKLEGPPVSIDMAKKEGWYGKNGSKWQTMPELMLRYRSATFFGRLYAPEVLMGMREEGEVIDVEATVQPAIERAQLPPPKTDPTPTPRGRRQKPAAAKKDETTSPPASGVGEPRSIVEQTAAKLAEGGYKPEELIKLAIENNWAETTTKTLEELGDDKLKFFQEDWGTVTHEIEEQRKRSKPERGPMD